MIEGNTESYVQNEQNAMHIRHKIVHSTVAPHAGAWIEIRNGAYHNKKFRVAPHAGAWIEMEVAKNDCGKIQRRPSRRGVD